MLTDIKLGTTTLLPYILVGYAGNILLPMQLGETLRAGLIRKHHGLSGSRLLSGILIEKGLDILTVVLILLIALLFALLPQGYPAKQVILASLYIICLTLCHVIGRRCRFSRLKKPVQIT